jgi:hypothetical protein
VLELQVRKDHKVTWDFRVTKVLVDPKVTLVELAMQVLKEIKVN